MSQIFTLSRPDLLGHTNEMPVRAGISLTFAMNQPEQHTLFRMGPDGRMKTRQVWKPTDEVRSRHGEMLQTFRGLDIPMPHAYGGVRGKNLRDNVEPHRGNEAFYMLDIKDAYASVDIDHLRLQTDNVLWRMRRGPKVRKEVDDFIADEAVIDGVPGLPLGYPASPYLFNLYCRGMDGRLSYAFSQLPWGRDQTVTYTRWLDDLTFSAPDRHTLGERKRRTIRDIIQEVPGFDVEPRKTKRHKLGKGAVTITGLSIYPDGRLTPAPALLDKVAKEFDAAEVVLREGGELTENELNTIHGFNSILYMAGKPERSGSRLVRTLNVRYQDIARRSLGMKMSISA